MKICVIAGYAPSLINFRYDLLRSLVLRGHQVCAVAPCTKKYPYIATKLKEIRVSFKPFSMTRNSLNPLEDFFTLLSLFLIFIRYKPDLVLAYTAKPAIYSGIAVRLAHFWCSSSTPRFMPLITGMGFAFTSGDESKSRYLLRRILQGLYRVGLRSAQAVIFQNPDDLAEFRAMQLLPQNALQVRVWGSGVNLDLFPAQPLPKFPVFLMLARLLVDKGIREYINAAREVKKCYPSAVFQLAGILDSNPAAISRNELESWIAEGVIEYLGNLDSVQLALASCRFYVLPSYREGTPRSVLEAMATGRPILTTDAPGCRETVIDGVNGLLVPPRDSEALAKAMLKLIEQPDTETQRMAQSSLELARERFDVRKVNAELLEVMGA